MAVIRGDFVHFQIRDARGPRTCRISQAALLLRERLNMEDGSAEIVLSIFIKHRREIERMAHAMASESPDEHRRIVITTAEFNE
jgi:uncharacterized protein YxjI